MKKTFTTFAMAIAITLSGMAAGSVQDEMLETFLRYARIDSQSDLDSACTAGQHTMALALKADVDDAVRRYNAKGITCTVSPTNYVYVTVPSNVKKTTPVLGISCHLDVTPEAPGGNINPIVDQKDGHTIVRTDGSTLLGADDKCGCTIAMQLIRTMLSDKKMRHGEVRFAFCPNEDVGRAAEDIDLTHFNPDILFDLDGAAGEEIMQSNFSARGFDVRFIGHAVHPSAAKELKLGDALAAAATFIAAFPTDVRPENTEGLQGYIHPANMKQDNDTVTVWTRVRYFDPKEGERFDSLLKEAMAKVERDFPNVKTEVIFDGIQYDNVALTMHPASHKLIETASEKTGIPVKFIDERAGTTAAMFAAKGLIGGMCLFSGQHEIHSTREYADLQQMEDAYRLMLNVITQIPDLK